jgi:hypothetical protein
VARLPAPARLLAAFIAAALAIAGCSHSDSHVDQSTASYGTLSGQITRGPTRPVSGPGIKVPPAPPVARAELKIVDSKDAVVATVRTGGDGRYRLTLPPGNYRVERGNGLSGTARNLPSIVAISPGGETRLDIWVDTGIRAPGGPPVTR